MRCRVGNLSRARLSADIAKKNKDTFPGGMWKVHTIYLALEKPALHATAKDWTKHIELLQKWSDRNPESITARVALAEAYVNEGWQARGNGYADTVSKDGWSIFENRAKRARETLERASKLSTKCPEWYVATGWASASAVRQESVLTRIHLRRIRTTG